MREGLRRMHDKQENVFYYITVMNENYQHSQIPKDCEKGILKGMYLSKEFKLQKEERRKQINFRNDYR